MSFKPKVSLIMSNYNYGQYLKAALDSVINQTYQNFELILIDDASTDNSIEIIKAFLKKYPFTHFIQHKENQGFFKSAQEGLDRAQGEYIAFPSSDDILMPHYLEKTVTILDKHQDVGLCFSRFTYFNSDEPKKIITPVGQTKHKEMKLSRDDLIRQIKMFRLWIPGIGTLTRKELFIKQGGYNLNYYSLSDWFLWLRIGFLHGSYFLPETLAIQRNHAKAMSSTELIDTKQKAWSAIIDFLSMRKNKILKKAFLRSHIFNSQGYLFFDYILKRPRYWLFFKQYVYKHFYPRWKKERLSNTSQPISPDQSSSHFISETDTNASARFFKTSKKEI